MSRRCKQFFIAWALTATDTDLKLQRRSNVYMPNLIPQEGRFAQPGGARLAITNTSGSLEPSSESVFYFFGEQDPAPVPGHSEDSFTEIIVASVKAQAERALVKLVDARVQGNSSLKLRMDFNCTRFGNLRARLVRLDSGDN